MTCIPVTPHVGVWIETGRKMLCTTPKWVTPHVGVWIETTDIVYMAPILMSLPTWECGLKHICAYKSYWHI